MTSSTRVLAALVILLLASGATSGDVFSWEALPLNSDWNNANNWAGTANQFPDDITDTAIVDGVPTNGIDPLLNLDVSVDTLTILNNGDVSLGTFSMFVYDATAVDGSGASLDVNDSPSVIDFDTNFLTIGAASGTATVTVDGAGALLQVDNALTINSGGLLDIDGSRVQVGDDLDLNVGGILRGDGVIQMNGVMGDDFINDGSIQATGGTLRIERSVGSASRFNWDGADTGGASLTVSSNSTMDIDLPLAEQLFAGTITLNTNSTLDIASEWGLSGPIQGVLNKDGAGIGTVAGSAVTPFPGSVVNINAGTLVFEADLSVSDGSTVNVATGSTLQLDGTANFNSDAVLIPAGVWSLNVGGNTTMYQQVLNWDGTGTLASVTTVGPSASLTINCWFIDTGGSDQFDGTLTINSGTVTVDHSNYDWIMNGTLNMDTAAGPANLSGHLVNVWGSISVTGGGIANVNAPMLFGAGSNTSIEGASRLAIGQAATVAAGATITGSGTLRVNSGASATLEDGAVVGVLVENAGQLDVGGSAGNAEVLEFSQTATGRLIVELGGTAPGEFDLLRVSGLATLGGTIDVRLADLGSGLFVPSAGESFLVLSAGSGFGGTRFTSESLAAIGGGLYFDVVYDTKKVIVAVAGVPGDYNRNGVVDAADYVVWRNTVGHSGVGLPADGDGDGDVDVNDRTVWRAHFGEVAPPIVPGVGSVADAIPEPTAVMLSVLSVIVLYSVTRQRARLLRRY